MNVEIKLYSSFNNFDRNEKERKNNIIKLLFKKTLNSIRYLFLFLFRIPVSIRNGILYPCPDQKFATIGVLFPVARDIFFFFFFSFHCSGPQPVQKQRERETGPWPRSPKKRLSEPEYPGPVALGQPLSFSLSPLSLLSCLPLPEEKMNKKKKRKGKRKRKKNMTVRRGYTKGPRKQYLYPEAIQNAITQIISLDFVCRIFFFRRTDIPQISYLGSIYY